MSRVFRRGRVPRSYLAEAIEQTTPAVSSTFARAFAELAKQVTAVPPGLEGRTLAPLSQPPSPPRPPNPLLRPPHPTAPATRGVRLAAGDWRPQSVPEMPTAPATPVGRHWQGVGDPPPADAPGLGERLRAQQQPIALGAPQASIRLEVRQSVDGVLAIRDARRTGRPGQPWLVIDVPPGHRAHWRDQSLSAIDVRTWTALLPEPDIDPRYFASYDQERLGTWPPKEQP